VGKLTDLQVKKMKWPGGVTRDGKPRTGSVRHSDGKGLYLVIKPSGAKSWVLDYKRPGRLREYMGLGGYPEVSLGEAREEALRFRKLIRKGLDPKVERDRDRLVIPTFAEAMAAAHKDLGKGWADKTAEGFLSSLNTHAVPHIGRLRVDEIEAADLNKALRPIWRDKPQIARKVRHRILQVLAYSKSHGWRSARVPDAKEISNGLGKQPTSEGHRAMPYKVLPAFMATELAKDDSPARLALLFTILTAARSGEARKATWAEIDFEERLWRRPAEHMKSRKAHDVALSDAAIAILARAEALKDKSGLIFPNSKGKALSDAALGKMLTLAGCAETVHGFRSTFRDWAAEKMPTIPGDVAEAALAHETGDRTVRAYLRTDFIEQRHALMAAWGQFAAPSLSGDMGNVTPISAASAA